MIDAIRLLLLIITPLFGLITYLLMLNALDENAIKPFPFIRYIGNLVNFLCLAKEAKDGSYYRQLLWGFLLSIILFVGTGLTFLAIPWQQ